MSATHYLVIGGGLAGGEAAQAIRKQDPAHDCTMVSAEPHPPYDRPPLTKEFLRGEKSREKLYFYTQEGLKEGGISALMGVRVTSLDLRAKNAVLSNGDTVSFQKLVLATGGSPNRLTIPGAELQGVHYLRVIEDSERIQAEARQGRRAVIIGGGFIGLEAAASLTARGVRVTVVESAPHIWPRFANAEIAGYFQRFMEDKGVSFVTGTTVAQIKGRGGKIVAVGTETRNELPCDFVCAAVGIKPNLDLAETNGLRLANGGVEVDQFLRTSHPDVYAAGDIAAYPDPYFGYRRRVEHWGQADYTGRLAGQNVAGAGNAYDFLTYVWSEIFDVHLEFAGDETRHDRMLLRGSFEEGAFTAMYLHQGRLVAYFAVNADSASFPILQKAIQAKKDVSGVAARLQDPKADLVEVLG